MADRLYFAGPEDSYLLAGLTPGAWARGDELDDEPDEHLAIQRTQHKWVNTSEEPGFRTGAVRS
ncbi:hypothetical protein ACIBH1_45550 [Nonomuraea sp. NPDC050663]|uniref:hypothetical protein n=1 Tax=Nonomuraea sp. NPDC050663 TaxID=3364370 RepID=UPI0037B5C7C0